MKKFFDIIDTILKAIVVVIVASFIIIVFAQVIARYVFNHSLSWSEELARVLFTQMIFLAAPLAVTERRHITVDIIVQYLPRNVNRWLHVILSLICFAFFCFLAVSGYTFMMANTNQTTAALKLPMGLLYGVIPFSSVLMAINCVRAGIYEFFDLYGPEKEKGELE